MYLTASIEKTDKKNKISFQKCESKWYISVGKVGVHSHGEGACVDCTSLCFVTRNSFREIRQLAHTMKVSGTMPVDDGPPRWDEETEKFVPTRR